MIKKDSLICFFSLCIQRLVDGADEYLQLLDVASNTIRALSEMAQDF